MKINISFLNPTRVGSLSMRLFFLTFGKCFTVYKGLSVPLQKAPQRWLLLSKVGDTETETSSWDSRLGLPAGLLKGAQQVCKRADLHPGPQTPESILAGSTDPTG